MIPQKNQHIKCIFKNGTALDGIVEVWSENESILKSMIDQSIVIIPHTSEDIMLIKIILSPAIQIKTKLEQQFEQTQQQPSSDDLRIKKLAELKIMMANADRKIIANKLKEHQIGETKKVNYEQPRFFSNKGIK